MPPSSCTPAGGPAKSNVALWIVSNEIGIYLYAWIRIVDDAGDGVGDGNGVMVGIIVAVGAGVGVLRGVALLVGIGDGVLEGVDVTVGGGVGVLVKGIATAA